MRKITLIFNAREHQFEIGSRKSFREMAADYSQFNDLMREGHATFILNRNVFTSDSFIPSEIEVEAMITSRRTADPNFLYDTTNLKFMITPAKVKQGVIDELVAYQNRNWRIMVNSNTPSLNRIPCGHTFKILTTE